MHPKPSKYKNQKTGGYDSKKEAAFAAKLELFRNANNPAERVVVIEKQVKFELVPSQRIDGKCAERACHYIADFRVEYADGRKEVIDVKGFKTADYIIKRKLMLKVHGIQIREV
ncbi:DUF1064 domain-containing protein [Janthinobacterium sp. B9-8]|uniref:DUF1064 domain-containing protein n=1 Tax=Janthinobacterium sp. B9-8 TaxID=1236179 RepID=UPI00061D04A9|nr:DUF1064 domain-containing protein [Janthinobacterium sp. B9-8]AMC34746.1 hypothetical protein VN23_09055 [Janthinobacterium sp. B9-8]